MTGQTGEDLRAALVERIAGVLMPPLGIYAPDWPPSVRAAYNAVTGSLGEARAAAECEHRRLSAEAVLTLLGSGDAGVHLVTGRDLQESVGVVLGQLHEARAEVEQLTKELAHAREATARAGHELTRTRASAAASARADDQAPTTTAAPCCPHAASEHGNDGCLHGWGDTTRRAGGCMCARPGMADYQ